MTAGSVADDALDCVPCVASGCDPTTLAISPAEGFLLSRIDGQTSWRLLREIGGLPPADVDRSLWSWLDSGLIEIDADGPGPPPRPETAAPDRWDLDVEIDESLIDPELAIDVDAQRRILAFDANLDREDAEILGLPADASLREVKRTYFKLSREFHPDRYFRREIAEYDERLHRVFKRILTAYERMSDPGSREVAPRADEPRETDSAEDVPECEATPEPKADPEAGPKIRVEPLDLPQEEAGEAAPEPTPELTRLERLRRRMPFKLPEKMASDRRTRGAALYFEAKDSLARGQHVEALKTIKLAVAFDPFNDDYKELHGECQAKLAADEARQLLAQPTLHVSEARDVFRRLVEASGKFAFDAALDDLTARLGLAVEDRDGALRHAARATEFAPDEGAYRRTHGLALEEGGDREAAISELERALELDPQDNEARRHLATLTKRTKPI